MVTFDNELLIIRNIPIVFLTCNLYECVYKKIILFSFLGQKKDMVDMSLDELDELEDDEDEQILEEFRRRRIAELKEQARKNVFSEVVEINGQDFVNQINKAGTGIWVVLLLYKQG